MTAATQQHGRGGSSVSAFGGMTFRYCLCGEQFTGTGEATFAAREQHIAERSEPDAAN
jgi:hypothetical protein